MLEAHQAGYLLEFLGLDAAAISGADHRSHAGSSHTIDGNPLFFKNLEDADVSQAAGEPAAEGNPDSRRPGGGRLGCCCRGRLSSLAKA
jgi:hypothetical protein